LLNLFSIGFFEESAFAADGWRPGWTTCHRVAKEKMRLRWKEKKADRAGEVD
jgi:hypothetical protein